MNKEQQPIPEEIRKRFEDKAEAQFPEAGMNANGDKKSRQHQRAYMAGAEAMYHHLSPEIARLKAERDAYRKLFGEIFYGLDYEMKLAVAPILDQYSSPAPIKDKP